MPVLTNFPNRIQVLSFLLSFGFFLTITICVVAWFFGGMLSVIVIAGLLVTIGMVVVEIIRRNATLQLYKLWNKLAKYYSFFIYWWITTVCFYVIFAPIGMPGNDRRFRSLEGTQSMWSTRTAPSKDTYKIQYNENYIQKNGAGKWIGNYLKWNITTRNKWMIFLLPFLVLLKIHKVEEEKKFPANIYTLY